MARKTAVACAATFSLYVSLTTPATATDLWGCEVLLCLSNPAGPTAVAQCVPPIERLWRHLAALRPFPHCEFVGPDSVSLGSDFYQDCPAGTVEVRRRLQAEFVGQGVQPRRCAEPRVLECLRNRARYWQVPAWCSESAIFQAPARREPCWVQVRIQQADGSFYAHRTWYRSRRCGR